MCTCVCVCVCVWVCACVCVSVFVSHDSHIKRQRTQSTTECNIISNTSNHVTIECLCHGLDRLIARFSPCHEFRNHRIVVYLCFVFQVCVCVGISYRVIWTTKPYGDFRTLQDSRIDSYDFRFGTTFCRLLITWETSDRPVFFWNENCDRSHEKKKVTRTEENFSWDPPHRLSTPYSIHWTVRSCYVPVFERNIRVVSCV